MAAPASAAPPALPVSAATALQGAWCLTVAPVGAQPAPAPARDPAAGVGGGGFAGGGHPRHGTPRCGVAAGRHVAAAAAGSVADPRRQHCRGQGAPSGAAAAARWPPALQHAWPRLALQQGMPGQLSSTARKTQLLGRRQSLAEVPALLTWRSPHSGLPLRWVHHLRCHACQLHLQELRLCLCWHPLPRLGPGAHRTGHPEVPAMEWQHCRGGQHVVCRWQHSWGVPLSHDKGPASQVWSLLRLGGRCPPAGHG